MFLITIFISSIYSLDIFPNLGLVLSPFENIYTFDTYGMIKAQITFNLDNFSTFNEQHEAKCSKFSGKAYDEKKEVIKVNTTEILRKKVDKIIDQYQLSDKRIRTKRQAGIFAGFVAWDLIHEIFGTFSTNKKIEEIKGTLKLITKSVLVQASSIKEKIKFIDCLSQKRHGEYLSLILNQELKTVEEILYSLIFKTGLNPEIFNLYIQGCFSVTKTNDYFENSNFCRYLVAEQKFTAQITKIELIKNLNDNFAITIDFNMTFPKSLVPGNAVKILNLGVLRLNDTEITGVKISNLKNINTVIKPDMIGFNIKNCVTIKSYHVCPNEKLISNSLSDKNCLNSIFRNKTEFCETEYFSEKRECLIFNNDNTVILSSSVNYKILKTIKGNPNSVSTIEGYPGVYPIDFREPNLISMTLMCGKLTKSLYNVPTILNVTHNLYTGPDILTSLKNLNISEISENESIKTEDKKLNKIFDDLINAVNFKNYSTRDLIIFLIVGSLILIILIWFFHKKIKACAEKSRLDMV